MNWNDIKNIMARKHAADEKIARTAELMKKYWTAKNASEQQEQQLAAKTASDPCLRALRRKMIAAKHASDGMDNLQRVVKLIHTVIDRNPAYKVANIVADRNVRLEKARYTEEKAVTKEEETAKDQPEKPTTQQRQGEPHDGEGRSVTFSDGRTVTFKSAGEVPNIPVKQPPVVKSPYIPGSGKPLPNPVIPPKPRRLYNQLGLTRKQWESFKRHARSGMGPRLTMNTPVSAGIAKQ